MLLTQYETKCDNCRKDITAYKPNLWLKMDKAIYGLNICEICLKFCCIDVDKLTGSD